jgi:trans-aconitate methyltransferase
MKLGKGQAKQGSKFSQRLRCGFGQNIITLDSAIQFKHTNEKTFTSLSLLLASSAVMSQQLPAELQTPEVVSVNRMPMRASAFAFESKAMATKAGRRRNLNTL